MERVDFRTFIKPEIIIDVRTYAISYSAQRNKLFKSNVNDIYVNYRKLTK